eukprot:tig00021680_g23041.t1
MAPEVSHVELARATRDDLEAIVGVVNRGYFAKDAQWVKVPRTNEKEILELLDAPGDLLVLRLRPELELEAAAKPEASEAARGRVIGSVHVEIKGEEALMKMLAVDAGYQGRGLGRRFIGEIESCARARGAKAMTLWTLNVREDLLRYYPKLGYELTGKNYEWENRDVFVTEKVVMHELRKPL